MSRVAHAFAGGFIVKISGIVISLLLTGILARAMGAHGYGTYSYILAIISLLTIPAQIGLPALVTRETAKAQTRGEWAQINGLWRWATLIALFLSAATITISLIISIIISYSDIIFTIGLTIIPLIVIGNIRSGALRGLGKVVLGQIPEFILRPGLFAAACLMFLMWNEVGPLTPELAMTLHAGSAGIALAIGAVILQRAKPSPLLIEKQHVTDTGAWWKAAIPLGLVAGVHMINLQVGVIVLGSIGNAEDAGIFRVVMQASTLLALSIRVTDAVVAPRFAQFHAIGDVASIERLSIITARLNLMLMIPPALVLAFAGGPLLSFVLGEDFAGGGLALAIVVGGRLVHAAMGPVEHLLSMTGHERETLRGLAWAAAGNILLSLALVPLWGANGAAIATTITMLAWNILLRQAVIEKLGIRCSALSPFIRRR